MTATAPRVRRRERPDGPLFAHHHDVALDTELEERIQRAALAARLSPTSLIRSILASTVAHLPADDR